VSPTDPTRRASKGPLFVGLIVVALLLGLIVSASLGAFKATKGKSSTSSAQVESGSFTACPLPAYPDATCTGVPVGTKLVDVSGDLNVTTPGAVVSGVNVSGCIYAHVPGVVVKDSKAACIHTLDSARTSTPWMTIEDSEVDCGGAPGSSGVGDSNFRALRLNIHGCENGFDADGNADIEDSYIHDLFQSVQAHTDGLQSAIGSNLTINHNRFYAETPSLCGSRQGLDCGGTSAINVNNNAAGPHTTNLIISNNLLAGGAYTLYCPIPSMTNVQVFGNRFSRIFYPNGGNYGAASDCLNDNGTPRVSVWSNNVWDNTGKPV
jgi:hypothetical protein